MCRQLKRKIALFVCVSCCVSLCLTAFSKLSTRHVHLAVERGLGREIGAPPVFQISNSRTHTFMFKQRNSSEESSQRLVKQPDKVNSQRLVKQPDTENSQRLVEQPDKVNSQRLVKQPDTENSQRLVKQPDTENSQRLVEQPDKVNSTAQENRSGKFPETAQEGVGKHREEAAVVEAGVGRPLVGAVGPNTSIPCPERTQFLVGTLAGMHQDISPTELQALYPEMEAGGRLRPKDCVPRQRLAIIIPYRNRYPHLHIMLHNLLPFLQRQQADVTFFVIEQALPGTFNRGALLNVGFLEAEKVASFDCYIFHDVDMIPLNDGNFYRCGDNPRHFAVSMNKFGYKLYYSNYFGAVVGFSRKQFLTVNGCSNIYFGWGGEDDDLLSRLRNKNYTMVRYNLNIARYDMIKHKRDSGNEANLLRVALRKNAIKRQDVEGLNTARYKVNSLRQEHLYTWITVSLNKTEILETAPKLTLQIMRTEMAKLEKKQKLAQSKAHNITSTATTLRTTT